MHGDEALAHAVVIRWFTEFLWDRSLLDEEHTGKPLSAVIPENVLAIWKMLINDNQCTNQMLHKEFNNGPMATH